MHFETYYAMSTSTPTTPAKAKAKAPKNAAKKAASVPLRRGVPAVVPRHASCANSKSVVVSCTFNKNSEDLPLVHWTEAILAGISEAIRPTDRMITYRDHAHPLVLGTDPKFVMAELYGRRTGTSKGKGGSMHMFDKERNLFGGHGIVGGQIGLGAGIAFADKYRNEDHVTLCFFGDGAARQDFA